MSSGLAGSIGAELVRGVFRESTVDAGAQREAGQDRTATIDGLGRPQLPEEALPLFPGGRVVVTLMDGHVELRPPA
ncbi:hypothetical protein [Actinoplanes sp. NBRC 103695]|uniref:hypothetical protein n=1 Tax=Actinoplanes sp. NBRC 103695 TaxID=3032202 RepID=UPI0024A15C1A|nr:hypothetical protein [Actinoplanes sp. NBRC 103695]GLY92783.1 hypothetical protein Acsp02_00390 [Actinoplanes sp. NBRC 103695]